MYSVRHSKASSFALFWFAAAEYFVGPVYFKISVNGTPFGKNKETPFNTAIHLVLRMFQNINSARTTEQL